MLQEMARSCWQHVILKLAKKCGWDLEPILAAADVHVQLTDFDVEAATGLHALPLTLAMVCAVTGRSVANHVVFLGEMNAEGVLYSFEEAGCLYPKGMTGMEGVKIIVVPGANQKSLNRIVSGKVAAPEVRQRKIKVVGVNHVEEAIDKFLAENTIIFTREGNETVIT